MTVARDTIQRLLARRIVILDGATGTELQRRGMPAGVCPETWCLAHPAVLEEIHTAYAEAGADIIYTSTFGGNRLKLAQWAEGNTEEINRKLAVLARRAVGTKALVAGDIGSTGRFVAPFGDLPFEEAVALFREQIRGLLAGGVDLIVIETMMDIQEARAALIALRELTDIFCAVTMTYERNGRTLNGTDPVSALITLQSLGADAVGCNCSVGPEAMAGLIAAMKPYAAVPLVAKPNAGMPRLVDGVTTFDMEPAAFAAAGRLLTAAGANMAGGCCGSTPAHAAALRAALAKEKPRRPLRTVPASLSSARGALVLEPDQPLLIVGERINPTGKQDLQEELRTGKTGLIRRMAREQERQGARLLDVNVGLPGVDEVKAMEETVSVLSTTTALPLVIDSARPDVIEAALRRYPGRALINSISGERERLEKLLPVARKYGAMLILLPILDGELPVTAARRRAVIAEIFAKAKALGFTREDVVVDGLVMTVASQPSAAQAALETVAWCTRRLQCRTILGLSNISFGMPERRWINAAFLAMAQSAGLTMAIANPAGEEFMNMKAAGDVLLRKDTDAAAYLRRFSGKNREQDVAKADAAASPSAKIAEAVLTGNREDIAALVEEAVIAGHDAAVLVDEIMIPAIMRVGEMYEKKEYFLPQLMASAEAMKRAMACLEPYLEGRESRKGRGVVVLATVKGDIHDIGKNIVALMLRNHGYDVVDLGKDVAAERIVEKAREHQADVIGLSALMTTTMVHMKDVVSLARREGLNSKFIVGGAVVTRAFAASLDAAYAKDGVEAAKVVAEIMGKR